MRHDALVSAVDIVHALQEAMWDAEDIVRFTIGMFTVSPNAPSVVPGRVIFSLDLRHPDAATLRRLGDAIPEICRTARGRCEVSVKELLHDPPLEFPMAIRADDQVDLDRSGRTMDGYTVICRPRFALSSLHLPDRDDLHPLQERHQP